MMAERNSPHCVPTDSFISGDAQPTVSIEPNQSTEWIKSMVVAAPQKKNADQLQDPGSEQCKSTSQKLTF